MMTAVADVKRVMTVKELADFLGKSDDTIINYAKKSGIVLEHGKLTRFDRDQVQAIAGIAYKTVPAPIREAIQYTFGTPEKPVSQHTENSGVDNPIMAEAFKYMASAFDRLVQITQSQESRLSKIESRIEERQALLPPPEMKPADRVRMLVNSYCARTGTQQGPAYTELYRQMYYTYHRDINRLRGNSKKTGIEIAIEGGFIDEVEAMAIKLFKGEKSE